MAVITTKILQFFKLKNAWMGSVVGLIRTKHGITD